MSFEYPDDVHIEIHPNKITVYITSTELFDHRIFAIDVPFNVDNQFHCTNKTPWHPSIEPQSVDRNYCRIVSEDLEDTSSTYKTVMSLRKLIQNPMYSSPFNLDAAIQSRQNPDTFRIKHSELKKCEYDPFDKIEYVVIKKN